MCVNFEDDKNKEAVASEGPAGSAALIDLLLGCWETQGTNFELVYSSGQKWLHSSTNILAIHQWRTP